MSYICMFPMMGHFSAIIDHLPRLDRLFVQLVPQHGISRNARRMTYIDTVDLWMERNACYSLLMGKLFGSPTSSNYKHLRVFESGDAADRTSWLLAANHVQQNDGGWKVVGDGILARDPTAAKTDVGDEEDASSNLSVDSLSVEL